VLEPTIARVALQERIPSNLEMSVLCTGAALCIEEREERREKGQGGTRKLRGSLGDGI
jgi:hypothetical protein